MTIVEVPDPLKEGLKPNSSIFIVTSVVVEVPDPLKEGLKQLMPSQVEWWGLLKCLIH